MFPDRVKKGSPINRSSKPALYNMTFPELHDFLHTTCEKIEKEKHPIPASIYFEPDEINAVLYHGPVCGHHRLIEDQDFLPSVDRHLPDPGSVVPGIVNKPAISRLERKKSPCFVICTGTPPPACTFQIRHEPVRLEPK